MEGSRPQGPSRVEFGFLLRQVWGEPRDLKLSVEAMAARRDERVRSVVRFACEQVPWYGRAMRDRGLEPDDFETPCGRSLPRIRLLEGRDANFIERAGELPVHQYRLFRALRSVGIARWQVAQTAPAAFVARVIPSPGQDPATVEAQVRVAFEGLIGPGTEVAIEFPADLERTASGKVLSFIPWTPRFGRHSGPLRNEES